MRLIVWHGRRIFWMACAVLAFVIWAIVPSLRSNTFRVVTSLLNGRMIPIYSVETPQKRVAFSFDAVWGADQTKNLLSILRKHNVRTTFFLGGFWLEKYPEMVKLIAKEGHEIGNHTYTHPHLNSLSPGQIEEELIRTHQLIYTLTGKKASLFRPPFGEYSNKVIESAEKCGYTTIIWDVDSLDWKNLGSDAMIQRVYSGVHAGSIVLFHNAGLNTPQSIDALLGRLQSEGYEIVPISQLLIRGKTYNDHSGRQRPLIQPPLGDSPAKPENDGRVG